jgi:hypothetical protein
MEEVISPDVISNLSEYDLFFKILKWDFKMFKYKNFQKLLLIGVSIEN